ncbi:hypothetical protein P691DRAFT_811171 [Macrolepiota fuliginosa MF-IS2]|uniref:Uncharacterized protein n=1 Tax=Macrolepiota fuliginosa MF-IS2 TaxID=1400762 RepID=A0A9P5X2T2_9AGAR|nr:hypothetical protein P691DRAFT_811171 [Macrolepiota fuliginosa MF-IS2]
MPRYYLLRQDTPPPKLHHRFIHTLHNSLSHIAYEDHNSRNSCQTLYDEEWSGGAGRQKEVTTTDCKHGCVREE